MSSEEETTPIPQLPTPPDSETGTNRIVSEELFAQRLAEKKRDARRRKLWISLAIVAAFAVLAGAVWLALFSPVFKFRSAAVKVYGESPAVPASEVIKATADFQGESIFTLDTDAVEAAIKNQVPWVGGAAIERSLPKGLTITVTTRTAVGTLPDGNVVDASGAIMPPLPDTDYSGLARVAGEGDPARVAGAAVAAALLPPVLEVGASVDASNPEAVIITLRNGRVIKWGPARDNELKARVMAILIQQPAREYSVIDPAQPVTIN